MNILKLKEDLSGHPNQKFVKYLCDGLELGFDTLVSSNSLPTKECKNLQSAITQEDITDKLIQSEVTKGFLQGPFSSPPFQQYRVSPIGVAVGKYSKKPRLIVDLSAPHNNSEHFSVNELIDKESCSLSYVRIDDAIKIIQQLGVGTSMCKTDISDAFKIIPVSPSQWHLFCIRWKGSYYYYNKLAFGCRSSPKIFDTLSQAVCWIAQHIYGINHILHLLDDFITFEQPGIHDENMTKLLQLFNSLGIPIARHKTCGPSSVIEYLGIMLDADKMESRLPTDKLERITNFLLSFLDKTTCTKRELLQLLGHLNFASRVVLPGRTFVSHLISLSTQVKALHHHIKLNNECREDIRMWLHFLSCWNGLSVFYNTEVTSADDMLLYTDASGSLGYGGYFQGQWFSESWGTSRVFHLQSSSRDTSIAFKELYPIVVSAMLWGHMWVGKRILFMCDNTATVSIIQKGRSKAQHIMPLVRRLTLCAATHNFTVLSKHVPGKSNLIADSLSRLQIQKFRQLAPMSSPRPCQVPPPERVLWNSTQLSTLCGQPPLRQVPDRPTQQASTFT